MKNTSNHPSQPSAPQLLHSHPFRVSLLIFTLVCWTILEWKHYRDNPSFNRAVAELEQLATVGCEPPFKNCLSPFAAKHRVLEAMNREEIAFSDKVNQATFDMLEAAAEIKIATQKLSYLQSRGGAKTPQEVDLLSDVCEQVYFKKRVPSSQTAENKLKKLLPPGVTKAGYCWWKDEEESP